MRLHFSIGCHDYRRTTRFRQRIHFSRIQVLFAEHVLDAPESTTNSRSSGLRFDAGRHLFFEGEKNAALFFSFNFRILLATFHAASRAPCSCHSVSSWDRSSNFEALGLRCWWGSPGQIYTSEGFWSRMLARHTTAFVNRTHRIGFRMFELFRKIDEDFGGSISWNTQPNCRVLFNIATALLSPFFGPFSRLFINLAMRIRALFPKSATTLGLVEQAFWRVPFSTKWVIASSSEVILARPSRHSTTGTLASGTSGSRWFSLILPHERIRRRIWLCHFSTLIRIVAETTIVSFHTLPVGFPLSTISWSPSSTLFCSLILGSFHNFRFWPQNYSFVDSVRWFFSPLSSICDNQVKLSSDESPYCTIPIRSWVSQTLVFLICTVLPRCHQMGFASLIIEFRPI